MAVPMNVSVPIVMVTGPEISPSSSSTSTLPVHGPCSGSWVKPSSTVRPFAVMCTLRPLAERVRSWWHGHQKLVFEVEGRCLLGLQRRRLVDVLERANRHGHQPALDLGRPELDDVDRRDAEQSCLRVVDDVSVASGPPLLGVDALEDLLQFLQM